MEKIKLLAWIQQALKCMSNFTPMSSVFEANGTSRARSSTRLYRRWGEPALLQDVQVQNSGLRLAMRVCSNSWDINVLYMLTTLFPSIIALLLCYYFFPLSKPGSCSSFFLTYMPDLKRVRFQVFSEKIKQIDVSKTQNTYFAIRHWAWKCLTRFSSNC